MPVIPNPSVYAPGADITAQATTAVVANRFVAIAGNRVAGIPAGGVGGNIAVAPAAAAGRVFGVAATDAPVGGLVTVVRGASRVVRVTAAGAIAAFAEVQVGADGKATTKAAGVAVGYVVSGVADGGEAHVSLYA